SDGFGPINDVFGHQRPLRLCFPVCQFLPSNLVWPICSLFQGFLAGASRTVYSILYIGRAGAPTCTECISQQAPSIESRGSGCIRSADRPRIWVRYGYAWPIQLERLLVPSMPD